MGLYRFLAQRKTGAWHHNHTAHSVLALGWTPWQKTYEETTAKCLLQSLLSVQIHSWPQSPSRLLLSTGTDKETPLPLDYHHGFLFSFIYFSLCVFRLTLKSQSSQRWLCPHNLPCFTSRAQFCFVFFFSFKGLFTFILRFLVGLPVLCLCTMCMQRLWRPEEGSRSSGTKFT